MSDQHPIEDDETGSEDDAHAGALSDHALTARRLDKVRAMRDAGVDPYPLGWKRSAVAAEIHARFGDLDPGTETGERVQLTGRLMNTRELGKLTFGVLQDLSGRIQLFVDRSALGDERFAEFGALDGGDLIWVDGEVMTTRRGELSLRVHDFVLQAKAYRPLPEKWHGLQDVETRSRRRYVDLMVNEDARRIALTRARIVAELRNQFTRRGYTEFETPMLQNLAGGALARPFETHHNALSIGMYLRIATELHLKRLIVGGLEKVFEIGRVFRNEGIDATHNPEYTMLESYEAYADYHDIMVMVEDVVAAVVQEVNGSTQVTYGERGIDLSAPYRRARLIDLVSDATGEDISFDCDWDQLAGLAREHGIQVESDWGKGKIINELFEELVADHIWDPTYVIDHPKEVSPLAREHRDDPNLAERFELFIAGSEYANAFTELNDPIDQRARFEAQAKAKAGGDEEAMSVDEDFLLALEYGMPPTGGLGIGVDRLVMLLTDSHHIREVLLFPTMRPE
ncbi:MAG: lysine--tRNA ligase [Acidimicrobiia bacterium]|nr:lysine--tRNA ligase [Acidimicrobiia bacterium]